MPASLTHTPRQTPEPGSESSSGLEIIRPGIDAHLAEQGIVPVEGLRFTRSGLAVYEIRKDLTDGPVDEALKKGLIDPDEAADLTLDALRVISAMHERGLEAHGDIRPSHILIDRAHQTAAIGGFHATEADELALADIGLDVSHISDGDESYVDEHFTAPEVVMGGEVDARSDVYEAAKTIMYILSNGRRMPSVKYFDDVVGNPFEPANPPDLSTGFPARTANPVRFALQQALDPNPDRRQSMRQLIEEISQGVYPWVAPVPKRTFRSRFSAHRLGLFSRP